MSANVDEWNQPFCGACMTNHPRDGVCISKLEDAVIEAAIKFVGGVGYAGSSFDAECAAAQQFVDSYKAFIDATRALIAAGGKDKAELHRQFWGKGHCCHRDCAVCETAT